MKQLRQFFIVDELQDAAIQGDGGRLAVIREIVRRIKLSQLKEKKIADDDMVVTVLESYRSDLAEQLDLLDRYLEKAKK